MEVKCENGSGYWDYDKWGAVVVEINEKTKCNLIFNDAPVEETNWRNWIQKGEVTKYYATLHNFLSDNENVEKVFNNREASIYLKDMPTLITEIKQDENFYSRPSSETGENLDSRSELVKIILNSTGLTNKEKYDNKLPFYVFKNGESFLTFSNYTVRGFNGGTSPVYSAKFGTSLYNYAKTNGGDCFYHLYASTQTLNLSNYNISTIRYDSTSTGIGISIGYGKNNSSAKLTNIMTDTTTKKWLVFL